MSQVHEALKQNDTQNKEIKMKTLLKRSLTTLRTHDLRESHTESLMCTVTTKTCTLCCHDDSGDRMTLFINISVIIHAHRLATKN